MSRTIKGIDKTLRKLHELGEKGVKGVNQVTEATSTEIALNARIKAPKDLGRLQGSIVSSKVSDLTYQVVAGESYAAYVEFGTGVRVQVPVEFQEMANRFRGGNGGSFRDGLESIKDWCRRHGIDESAAYPIFMSILKKGIAPQPFLYPAFVQGREQYLRDLKALLKRLTK